MSNTTVTLMRYCKTPVGWRRFKAVVGKNGKVRPGYAVVGGKAVMFPEGTYQVRYYHGSKVAYLNAGDDAQGAMTACARHERLLQARDTASAAGAKIVEPSGRVNLRAALQRFLDDVERRDAMVARDAYRLACDAFLGITPVAYLDEITAQDFPKFWSALRKRGFSDRTIHNKQVSVASFLRHAGLPSGILPKRLPRYEKKLPDIYSGGDLTAFFAAIESDYDRVVFMLALKCGLRDQEIMHLEWTDITGTTLRVRSKPAWGFRVKDKEERDIPIPKDLLKLLHKYRQHCEERQLVTGTVNDRPNNHLLRVLKRLVHRANLDCKVCEGCQAHNECRKWTLHAFRRTYCTTLHRSGLDASSIMQLMGHSEMETTMRYLRPHENKVLHSKINAIVWGLD